MKKILLILTLFATSIVLISCNIKKVDIMTSSFFNYDIVKTITKRTNITYDIITEPGKTSEHNIHESLNSKKIYMLKNAKIFIYTSITIDEKILANKNNLPANTINLYKEIYPENEDPICHQHAHIEHDEIIDKHSLIHYWTSVENIIKATRIIADKLITLFPYAGEILDINAVNYIEKLTKVKNELIGYLNNKKPKKIIYLSHDAIGAFAKEFKLDYHPFSISLDDNTKETANQISNVIALIKKETISTVFLPELNTQEKLFNLIKKEVPQLKGLELSTYHNISSSDFKNGLTYYDILESNIKNIKEYIN